MSRTINQIVQTGKACAHKIVPAQMEEQSELGLFVCFLSK